eukprot:8702115-Pyramimonas_sp.AAC.1
MDSDSATNLGVDFCAGRPSRVRGRNSKAKERFRRAKDRTDRLVRMRPTISGKRRRNVFVADPLPGAVYGREISGVTDHEFLSLR